MFEAWLSERGEVDDDVEIVDDKTKYRHPNMLSTHSGQFLNPSLLSFEAWPHVGLYIRLCYPLPLVPVSPPSPWRPQLPCRAHPEWSFPTRNQHGNTVFRRAIIGTCAGIAQLGFSFVKCRLSSWSGWLKVRWDEIRFVMQCTLVVLSGCYPSRGPV
jgi:hypothetical protein